MIEKEEEDNDYVGSNLSPLANIAKARVAAQKTDSLHLRAGLSKSKSTPESLSSTPPLKSASQSSSKSVKFRMDEEVTMNVPPSARKAKAKESLKAVSFVPESPHSNPRPEKSLKLQLRDSTPARELKSGKKLDQRQATPRLPHSSGKAASQIQQQSSSEDESAHDSDGNGSNDDTLDITLSGQRNKSASGDSDEDDGNEVRELDFDEDDFNDEQYISNDEEPENDDEAENREVSVDDDDSGSESGSDFSESSADSGGACGAAGTSSRKKKKASQLLFFYRHAVN
jgi:hypothetical protein